MADHGFGVEFVDFQSDVGLCLSDYRDYCFSSNGSVNVPTKKGGSTTISRDQVPMVLVIGLAVFMFGFFTIHFGLFHFVHSVFLNSFFPLSG